MATINGDHRPRVTARVLPFRRPRRRRRLRLSMPMPMLIVLLVGFGGLVATEAIDASADDLAGNARVRDGDTLVVDGTPVRLQGLHCPELSEPGGERASNALAGMVSGRQVSCSLTGERTYDRMVGRCQVDGADLAAALIRAGACARCARYDPLMRYLPAQLEAGRWRGSMPGYC